MLSLKLDDKDDELAEMDDALAKSRKRYDQHTFYWISHTQNCIAGRAER